MADNKRKRITVSEIKQIEHKADIYELNPYSRYLVTVKKSELDIGGKIAEQKAAVIMNVFSQAGIPCVVLIGIGDDVKIMEIGDGK